MTVEMTHPAFAVAAEFLKVNPDPTQEHLVMVGWDAAMDVKRKGSEDHGDCACEKCQPALFAARARIAELEKALRAVEWFGWDLALDERACPDCNGRKPKHDHDCLVGQALRRPGEGESAGGEG